MQKKICLILFAVFFHANEIISQYIQEDTAFPISANDSLIRSMEMEHVHKLPNFKPLRGKKVSLHIDSQQDFDHLNDELNNAMGRADVRLVEVYMDEGPFTFREGQFSLKGINRPEVSLKFTGRNTVIAAEGFVKGQDLGTETEMTPDSIEIVDLASKLCRIRLNTIPQEPVKRIQITQWYLSEKYDVEEIRDGWAYFRPRELFYMTDEWMRQWNVNWDLGFGKTNPRYRLFGDHKECQNGRLLIFKDCQLHQLSISGISVRGNGGRNSLLEFNGLQTNGVFVHDCLFENIHTTVFSVYSTPNVVFQHNTVARSYGWGIICGKGSHRMAIIGNRFYDNGQGMNNTVDVLMQSANFYVADNEFRNLQYSAVSIGYNWAVNQEDEVTGIVERNEMWQDSTFRANHEKYTLMDGGPVYVSTRQDKVIIRYNHIHDVTGMKENRGIFCDDGARNLKIYGNVIHGMGNSYCIDSRLVDHVSEKVPDYNTGNLMIYNIIGGNYKFEGRKDNLENNIQGRNVIVYPGDENKPVNTVSNLSSMEDDIDMEQKGLDERYLLIKDCHKKTLMSCPVWKGMKQWIKFVK